MILTLSEVKTHLRIEHDEEDDYLSTLILQAQSAAEDYTRVTYADAASSETPDGEGTEESDQQEDTTARPAPEPVRLACLLMVSYLYENRDVPDTASYNAMRRAFNNLLYPHRDPELMF